jgi:hypothetical protein
MPNIFLCRCDFVVSDLVKMFVAVLKLSGKRLEFFSFSLCLRGGLLSHAHQIFDEIFMRD